MRSSVTSNGSSTVMLLLFGIVVLGITIIHAAPHPASYGGYYSPVYLESQNPEYLLETIARLREALTRDNDLEKGSSLLLRGKQKRRLVVELDPEYYQDDEINEELSPEDLRELYQEELVLRKAQKKQMPDFGLQRGITGEIENKMHRNKDLLEFLG